MHRRVIISLEKLAAKKGIDVSKKITQLDDKFLLREELEEAIESEKRHLKSNQADLQQAKKIVKVSAAVNCSDACLNEASRLHPPTDSTPFQRLCRANDFAKAIVDKSVEVTKLEALLATNNTAVHKLSLMEAELFQLEREMKGCDAQYSDCLAENVRLASEVAKIKDLYESSKDRASESIREKIEQIVKISADFQASKSHFTDLNAEQAQQVNDKKYIAELTGQLHSLEGLLASTEIEGKEIEKAYLSEVQSFQQAKEDFEMISEEKEDFFEELDIIDLKNQLFQKQKEEKEIEQFEELKNASLGIVEQKRRTTILNANIRRLEEQVRDLKLKQSNKKEKDSSKRETIAKKLELAEAEEKELDEFLSRYEEQNLKDVQKSEGSLPSMSFDEMSVSNFSK